MNSHSHLVDNLFGLALQPVMLRDEFLESARQQLVVIHFDPAKPVCFL